MKAIYLSLIGIFIFIMLNCKNTEPKNNVLINSSINSNLKIDKYLHQYLEYCKSREDTVKVIVLNVENQSDSTIIYISSVKSLSFLRENYPTAFTFLDDVLIIVFTGSEKIMDKDSNKIRDYLNTINEFSVKHNLQEYTLHNPINWSVSIKDNVNNLRKDLSDEIILQKIYHMKSGTKPKIIFHKDSIDN